MSIFKIHSFSNFQICNTALLTTVTMLCIAFYFIHNSKFIPFDPFTHFPTPSWALFVCLFLDSIYKWYHKVFVILSLTFHIASCHQSPSMSHQTIGFPSFLQLNNSPLTYTSSLPIHPLMSTYTVSESWLLWIIPRWTRERRGLQDVALISFRYIQKWDCWILW